ncbi:MAG: RHS repeat-associated core domain-containing protein [Terracidiphilus sp.]
MNENCDNNEPRNRTKYTYDANSNLQTKTDARSIQVNFGSYDGLNRSPGKTFSNGDPAVTFTYDATGSGNYGVGHRTGMSDGSGSTTWTYEKMGRVSSESRTISGINKTVSTTYTPDGTPWKITYPSPSNSVVEYKYNNAGQILSITDNTHTIPYASSASYAPPGGLASAIFGSAGISGSNTYNSRLQPLAITATGPHGTIINLSFNYHLGASDNGNLFAITNSKDTTRNQAFTYDTLNRVLQATSGTTWGTAFVYDPWGNLYQTNTVPGTGTNPMSLSQAVNTNNRFTLGGFGYDSAGNVTSDGINTSGCSSGGYAWNAEEMASCTAGVTYTYNGDDARVKKSGGTMYWGGEQGDALAESDLSGNLTSEYIFMGAKRLARRDISSGNVYYFFSDHLGSSNVVTDASGSIQDESDFYPFGGERPITNLLPNHYKLTGKERDTESFNDYFGARFYRSTVGRFMSPDWSTVPVPIPFADITSPQSLNLYAYVWNNPLSRFDSDGHVVVDKGVNYVYYRVTGATAKEALASANQHFDGKYSGMTTPHFEVNFKPTMSVTASGENTKVTLTAPSDDKVTTTLSQTIQLPEWKSSDPAEQAAFDKSTAHLKEHEETHAADNLSVAEALDKSIPGTSASATSKNPQNAANAASTKLNTKVGDKLNAAVADSVEKARVLDDNTEHGTKP